MSYFDVDKRKNGDYGTLSHNSGSLGDIAPGANDVPSFQISGVPYAVYNSTFSNTSVKFPMVTQWIVISSTASEVKYSFRAGGIAAGDYGSVAAKTSTPVMPIRTAEIWVTGNGSVTAGLTGIPSGSLKINVDQYNS
tara:strand:- start:453 stop:863 length:411 start_codon:yes stop_codon:yes gene_type:complete